MKIKSTKRIIAIILSAFLLVSAVTAAGIADSMGSAADVALGAGNYFVNGGFEADRAVTGTAGHFTTGWALRKSVSVVPSLSADAYEGEQSLKMEFGAGAAFTLTPDFADENGNISNFAQGIYTFSCYAKGNAALVFQTWDANGLIKTEYFNEACENITEWRLFSVAFSVPKSGSARFLIGSAETAAAGQYIFIDNASLRRNTAVINGDFEGAGAMPEVDANLIVNGDFEQGFVTSMQIGGFGDKGDETTKIFCAEDGGILKNNYYFNTFTTQGIRAYLNTDSQFVYSGSRSLKLTNIVADGLNNRFFLYPESATAVRNINGQRVYFMEGLESGAYDFEVYAKIPTDHTAVILYAYNWSSSSSQIAVDTANLTADENGWLPIRYTFTVGADGMLGFSLYSLLGNAVPKEIYFDHMSLTRKEDAADAQYIVNGGFEQGEFVTSQIGGYPAKGDVSSKIFCGENNAVLSAGYYFNTFTSQAVKGAVSTDPAYVRSGDRSLKLSNMTGNYNSRFNMVPEAATQAKKINGQTVLFLPGVPEGEYTAEVYVKLVTEKNNSPVILAVYDWESSTRTIAASTADTAPDQDGWYHLTAQAAASADGFLGIALCCEFGSSQAMDVYIDDFVLGGKDSVSETVYETEIEYWSTTSPNGGASVLSLDGDDTISGENALKLTQQEGQSITLTPAINSYSLQPGYQMLAFWAKGTGTVSVSIQTASGLLEKEFTLRQEWVRYTIRDIEVKSGDTISRLAFTFSGAFARMDAVQLYAQAGPAKLTEKFEIREGTKALCLPPVSDGYTVLVKSVSDRKVVNLNGLITQPDYNTDVDVVLRVSNINDPTDTADSHTITVKVPGKYGDAPKTEYPSVSLNDRETGVSVEGGMAPGAKFRVMRLSEDNRFYEEMLLEGNRCIAFYNTVITPAGGYSPALVFRFPVDAAYNGKVITVVYRDDNGEITTWQVTAENGFVTVKASADGFFMLQIPKEKAAVSPGASHADARADAPAAEISVKKPAENKSSEEKTEPVVSEETANRRLSVRKLIDETAVWIAVIVAAAIILIMIELTGTVVMQKKLKR